MGEKVAIKQINFVAFAKFMPLKDIAEHLMKELSIMASFQHPNLLPLVGVSYDRDFLIVTKLCTTTFEDAILSNTYNEYEIWKFILGIA